MGHVGTTVFLAKITSFQRTSFLPDVFILEKTLHFSSPTFHSLPVCLHWASRESSCLRTSNRLPRSCGIFPWVRLYWPCRSGGHIFRRSWTRLDLVILIALISSGRLLRYLLRCSIWFAKLWMVTLPGFFKCTLILFRRGTHKKTVLNVKGLL